MSEEYCERRIYDMSRYEPYETKLSKFISLILRHKPEVIGKKIDKNGYMTVVDLLSGLNKYGYRIDMSLLEKIVAADKKQRYSFNSDKTQIRANQGHSIKVDLRLNEITPPDILYHGTGMKYLSSILSKGLIKKSRQYVHLSKDYSTAMDIGKRHGRPIVLAVNTQQMVKEGFKFYLSRNGIWLSDDIPSKYISIAYN